MKKSCFIERNKNCRSAFRTTVTERKDEMEVKLPFKIQQEYVCNPEKITYVLRVGTLYTRIRESKHRIPLDETRRTRRVPVVTSTATHGWSKVHDNPFPDPHPLHVTRDTRTKGGGTRSPSLSFTGSSCRTPIPRVPRPPVPQLRSDPSPSTSSQTYPQNFHYWRLKRTILLDWSGLGVP